VCSLQIWAAPAPHLTLFRSRFYLRRDIGYRNRPAHYFVQVPVSYQCKTSSSFAVPVAVSSPAIFSLNGTGAGQAAALNGDGSLNDAAHPVKIGGYVSLYATGEGQTTPAGTDGKIAPVMQPCRKRRCR
jgi:uncharacterized protein (TIGR03437 family)